MSKKRKEIPWRENVVGRHDDFDEAMKAVKASDIKWKRQGGGEGGRRVTFCCASHQKCNVRCRVVLQRDGRANVEENGEQHSGLATKYDRPNAGLTIEQKEEAKTAMRYGSHPSTAAHEMCDKQIADEGSGLVMCCP